MLFLQVSLSPPFAPAMALVPPSLLSGRAAAGATDLGCSNGVVSARVSIGEEGKGVHRRDAVGVRADLVQRPASCGADVVGPTRAFGDAGTPSAARQDKSLTNKQR